MLQVPITILVRQRNVDERVMNGMMNNSKNHTSKKVKLMLKNQKDAATSAEANIAKGKPSKFLMTCVNVRI
jgi:hypothetical protein